MRISGADIQLMSENVHLKRHISGKTVPSGISVQPPVPILSLSSRKGSACQEFPRLILSSWTEFTGISLMSIVERQFSQQGIGKPREGETNLLILTHKIGDEDKNARDRTPSVPSKNSLDSKQKKHWKCLYSALPTFQVSVISTVSKVIKIFFLNPVCMVLNKWTSGVPTFTLQSRSPAQVYWTGGFRGPGTWFLMPTTFLQSRHHPGDFDEGIRVVSS